MRKILLLFLLILSSCNVLEKKAKSRPAFCFVESKLDSKVNGMVFFIPTDEGLRVVANISGLSPGKHGFHVHEHGDCSAHDGSSAGGHFNPKGQKHGGPMSVIRHAGDLGNLEANKNGVAHYDRIDKQISLSGELNIIGKSIVVHEKEDDLSTDPTGNAGARIGCGEIISF